MNRGVVPTLAELARDRSALAAYTTRQTDVDAQGNLVLVSDPFRNQNFYPAPNLVAARGQHNFINTEPTTTNIERWSARVDAAFFCNTSRFCEEVFL